VEQLKKYIDGIKIRRLCNGRIYVCGDIALMRYGYADVINVQSQYLTYMILHDMLGVDKVIFESRPSDVYEWDERKEEYILRYGSNPNPEYEKIKKLLWL